MRRLLISMAVLCLMAVPALAQSVTFAWDPHPEAAQITGFKLYQSKTSGSYTGAPVATWTLGTLTTGQIPQPALGRYYFVLTAFKDDSGTIIESDHSNEVTLVLKPKPPKLISVVQTIAAAPVKAATAVAGLFQQKKSLRIEK